jgi:hypothetical protein
MYRSVGSADAWRLDEALRSMVGYPLDRIWGLLPHAPVYLFALPGWILAARADRRATTLISLLVAALAIPSAGHGFTAFGASPLRHLVAVVPLAMLPVASVLLAWGHRRWVRLAFGLLLIVSLDASLSYNVHHYKEVGRMVDWAASGWAPNLLFPWTHAEPWLAWRGTFVLFGFWASGAVGLALMPWIIRRGVSPMLQTIDLGHSVSAVAAFVALATAATALGGEWTRRDYFPPPDVMRDAALAAARGIDRCRICYSSRRGEIGRITVLSGTAPTVTVQPIHHDVRVGEPAVFRVTPRSIEGDLAGTLAIDFGDETRSRIDLFGSTDIAHVYATPGVRSVIMHLTAAGGWPQQRVYDVNVRPEVVRVTDLSRLPEPVRRAPVRGAISRVWLGPAGLTVEHPDGTATGDAVAAFAWTGADWRVVPNGAADGGAPETWVAVMAVAPGASFRTEPVLVRWPDPGLWLGAPLVLFDR